jgi:hypothetical protein
LVSLTSTPTSGRAGNDVLSMLHMLNVVSTGCAHR